MAGTSYPYNLNKFKFFDKGGNSLNLSMELVVSVNIIDTSDIPGSGAKIIPITNSKGEIFTLDILSSGVGYSTNTYISFTNTLNNNSWTISPSDITLSPNGEITSITLPTSSDNSGFPFPSIYWKGEGYFDRVSTNLIENQHIFVLEEVLKDSEISYTYPRYNDYGPYTIKSYSASNGKAKVEIDVRSINITTAQNSTTVTFTNIVNPPKIGDIVLNTSPYTNLFPNKTQFLDFTNLTTAILSNVSSTTLTSYPIDFYTPHGLKEGSKITISGTSDIDGVYILTHVDETNLYFDSDLSIPSTPGSGAYYTVEPVIVSKLVGTEYEFFQYQIEYNENYPTITKYQNLEQVLTNSDALGDSYTFFNNEYTREITSTIEPSTLQMNMGFSSPVEGTYVNLFSLEDNTFDTTRYLLQFALRAEAEGEDERFGKMLENFGRDVTLNQEMLFRDSDINESEVDYNLLNRKRKEMLLEGDNIWPYVGSYKGLVNIINWFGYYDIRIKEYWLNINEKDDYFGKFKQLQIPLQLKNKTQSDEALNILPSKHYKKTSYFGLFYDINKNSGETDSFGIPLTEDSFLFTNEEVLIKLFGLKKYLKEKFLPLNARIVDIVGEGIYYERYAANTWKDDVNRLEVVLTRNVDFEVDNIRNQIIDIRPFVSKTELLSPGQGEILSNYINTYSIKSAIVTNGGGTFSEIPTISFQGQSKRSAKGFCKVRAQTITVTLSTPSGKNYAIGDIITLAGGSYDVPIRATVTTISGIDDGVLEFTINSGINQGSEYSSLPTGFYQNYAVRPIGNQYVTSNGNGFNFDSTLLSYEVERVVITDTGSGYSTPPIAVITPNLGTTVDLNLKVDSNFNPVGYFNNGFLIKNLPDSPNIPIGSPVELNVTTFKTTWDDLPYTWNELGSSNSATLKAIVDTLPSGTGTLKAVEIVSEGLDYKYTPKFKVSGGSGIDAEVRGSIRNGKLKKYLYQIVSNSSGNTYEIEPANDNSPDIKPIPSTPPVTALNQPLVTGDSIPYGTVVSAVTQPVLPSLPGAIDLIDVITGSPLIDPTLVGTYIYVHEGAYVYNQGSGFEETPHISANGGVSSTAFTWDNIGRGNFYQMEWKVTLTSGGEIGQQFFYRSGIKPIDDLETHSLTLPYAGKYTVELIVYDTSNNFVNEIKNDYIDVFLPEIEFSWITKHTNCVRNWNDIKEKTWNDFNSSWLNPIINKTKWDDLNIKWNSLDVGDNSIVNNYNFPTNKNNRIVQISPQDVHEGSILEIVGGTTASNPIIRVNGQLNRPELKTITTLLENQYYDNWLYLKREDVTYQLKVDNADYSTAAYTSFTIDQSLTPLPNAFIGNANGWNILREISGNIVIEGDVIFDPIVNPTGLTAGQFITSQQLSTTPLKKRIPIKDKLPYLSSSPLGITLDSNYINDSEFYRQGELGKIYKFRDYNSTNGNFMYNPSGSDPWFLITTSTGDYPGTKSKFEGKLYLNPSSITSSPLSEMRQGFTVISVFIKYNGVIIHEQKLQTIHSYLNTSNAGVFIDRGWSSSYDINVKSLGGCELDHFANVIIPYYNSLGAEIWVEYEYDVFPVKTYWTKISSNLDLYMDFNVFPSSEDFNDSLVFPSPLDNSGWYYDHGITEGTFSQKIINVGVWRYGEGINGNGKCTIIQVEDPNFELARMSTSFTSQWQSFDEDYAKTKLGTNVQKWNNYKGVTWEELCKQSWNSIDYHEASGCNFEILEINTNGRIKFNEEPIFEFEFISGLLSTEENWAQALYELNNTDNSGLVKFNYFLNGIQTFSGSLDTYNYPNDIIGVSTSYPFSTNEAIIGPGIQPSGGILTASLPTITMKDSLAKKETFTASTTVGSYYINNIQDLLFGQIYVGDIITGYGLPTSPSPPAKVIDITYIDGHVSKITLDTASTSTNIMTQFNIEWRLPNAEFQYLESGKTYSIKASARANSGDYLGYLNTSNGVFIKFPIEDIPFTIGHTYPLVNYEYWTKGDLSSNTIPNWGGENFNKLISDYRFLQTYFDQGTNPYGDPGWYPNPNMNRVYESQENQWKSYRLPYLSSMQGSYSWETLRAGKQNIKLPVGCVTQLVSDTCKIAGKTKFLWRIYENDKLIVETTDPSIMWTFNTDNKFDIELTVIDSNGNKKSAMKKGFVNIMK